MTPAAKEDGQSRPKAAGFPLAPLIEALIDVQFAQPLTDRELSRARDALVKVYPDFAETAHHEIKVDIDTETTDVTKEIQYRGTGGNPTEILLLRRGGLATSQLAPYKDWDHLYTRFSRDLKVLLDATGMRELTRMAVRSINRIDVPPSGDIVRYEDYIALHPSLPKGLDPIQGFRLQVTTLIKEVEAAAHINVGQMPPAVEGKASFVLDIDIFRTLDIPSDLDGLQSLFSEFRSAKNDLYRMCLTSKALEEFRE